MTFDARWPGEYGWELHQSPHRHYRYAGSWSIAKKRIVSVTQVLDAADDRLQQWMLGQAYVAGEKDGCAPGLMGRAYARGHGPTAIRDKAAALGTISHAALEALASGRWCGAKDEAHRRAQEYMMDRELHVGAVPLPRVSSQDLWPRFRALEDFFGDHAMTTEQAEVAVGSVRHCYAGTFDWFGRMDGVPTLLDAKNTNMLSWRHPVQLAGYELARREMGMPPAKRLLVLRLTAVATYEVADVAKLGGYAHARKTFLNRLQVFRAERRIDGLIDKHTKEQQPT